jgi:hypothetical protein
MLCSLMIKRTSGNFLRIISAVPSTHPSAVTITSQGSGAKDRRKSKVFTKSSTRLSVVIIIENFSMEGYQLTIFASHTEISFDDRQICTIGTFPEKEAHPE